MKLVFLTTEFILTAENDSSALYVPLNAIAMNDVLKKGLNFIKIEDHFDDEFAKKHKKGIRAIQQSILDELDAYLAKEMKDERIKNFGPYNLYSLWIMLCFDNHLVFYSILNSIIKKYTPTNVLLITKTPKRYSSFYTAPDELFSFILNTICAEQGVFFKKVYNEDLLNEQTNKKKVFYLFCGIFKLFYSKSTNIIKLFPPIFKLLRDPVFILRNENVGLREKITERAIFLQIGWGIFHYEQFFKKPIITAPVFWNNFCDTAPKVECTSEIRAIQSFVNQLNSILGFNAENSIKEVLSKLIPILKNTIPIANKYCEYFSSQKIKYVFYTNLSLDMHPAMLAANWMRLKTVCKSHGDTLLDDTKWATCQLKPSWLYITEYLEVSHYYCESAIQSGFPTKFIVDAVRNKKKRRYTSNNLVYVPTLFSDGCISYDNNNMFSSEYFRIQIQILSVLNKNEKYKVVYKSHPHNPEYHFPIQKYIQQHFKNIAISNKSIEKAFSDCACTLIDYPSSPMFDAIGSKVPFHVLSLNSLTLRNSAMQLFGKFVSLFESEHDVADIVASILAENRFYTIDRDDYGFDKIAKKEMLDIFKSQ